VGVARKAFCAKGLNAIFSGENIRTLPFFR
jgi:hypothetical protein